MKAWSAESAPVCPIPLGYKFLLGVPSFCVTARLIVHTAVQASTRLVSFHAGSDNLFTGSPFTNLLSNLEGGDFQNPSVAFPLPGVTGADLIVA